MRHHRGAALLGVMIVAASLAAAWTWYSPGATPPGRQSLATAIGGELPFAARLSGGFAPSNTPSRRTTATGSEALSPDARIALAELEKTAEATTSVEATADLGVVYLIHGQIDRAISLLQDAASEANAPLYWSDLSAAYLVKANRTPPRRIEFLSRGFEAAMQSIKLGVTSEALFNRALALEGLAPYVAEPAPWAEYVRTESDARWSETAGQFIAHQRPFEDASARWELRRRELRPRLASLDTAFVRDTVSQFPEASREHFEQDVIVAWAAARQRDDGAATAHFIAQAELLARALEEVTGDRMARDEVAALRKSPAVVARAHLAYIEGSAFYDANKYPQAKASFERALTDFVPRNHPYRYWALVRRATVDFQLRDVVSADATLAEVDAFARAHQYRTLLGWTLWVRGLVYLQQWRLTDALAAFQEAVTEIEKTRQREFAVSLYHLLANNLRTLGEQQQSWEYIGKTLEGLSLVRKPTRRYISYYNATLFATAQGLSEAALVFQNAAVREATKAAVEVRIDAVTQRAGVHIRRGDGATAARDLNEAAQLLENVADGSLKSYLKAEIDVLYAHLHRRDTPDEATRRVRNAISFFDKVEPARMPRLYLDLARSYLANDAATDAAAAMTDGILRLEEQQASLGNEALRISYFDESWELFDEMVALQLTRMNDVAAAFEFAERSRGRSLLAATEGTEVPRPRSLQMVRDALPPNVQLIYYYVLPEKLLLWLIDRDGTRLIEQSVDARRLTRAATQFRDEASEGHIRRPVNDELYRLLWGPVILNGARDRTIVVVADGDLQQIPFAALRDPDTGRYVIEDFTVVLSPSASFYVAAVSRSRHGAGDVSSALLVGNPAVTNGRPLPDAEREASEAAQFYPTRQILLGQAATKAAFLERAPHFDVIHFGGHALVNAEYPLLSRLMFSEGRDGDALFAHEITHLRFPRAKLVILAACSTARGAISRGEGALNIARPFLAGGVPVVIASQWDVDDRATAELFLAFHREFAISKNPALALRKAQLRLLHNPQSVDSSPASWGAFIALGATTH